MSYVWRRLAPKAGQPDRRTKTASDGCTRWSSSNTRVGGCCRWRWDVAYGRRGDAMQKRPKSQQRKKREGRRKRGDEEVTSKQRRTANTKRKDPSGTKTMGKEVSVAQKTAMENRMWTEGLLEKAMQQQWGEGARKRARRKGDNEFATMRRCDSVFFTGGAAAGWHPPVDSGQVPHLLTGVGEYIQLPLDGRLALSRQPTVVGWGDRRTLRAGTKSGATPALGLPANHSVCWFLPRETASAMKRPPADLLHVCWPSARGRGAFPHQNTRRTQAPFPHAPSRPPKAGKQRNGKTQRGRQPLQARWRFLLSPASGLHLPTVAALLAKAAWQPGNIRDAHGRSRRVDVLPGSSLFLCIH